MGYLVVTAVLVVTFGRLGDMYGRVRMYNAGFAVFSVASLALSLCPWTGSQRRDVAHRLARRAGHRRRAAHGELGGDPHRRVQGRATRLRDRRQRDRGHGRRVHRPRRRRHPRRHRLAGGVLDQRADRRVRHGLGLPQAARGRLAQEGRASTGGATSPSASGSSWCSSASPTACCPTAATSMGWTGPWVLFELIGGARPARRVLRDRDPGRRPDVQPRRSSASGRSRPATSPGCSPPIGRGGLQFMLIIWLQGIWLPLHGYSFERTPLWAGIYMLPLTGGFLLAGPVCGWLSDRYGARRFATGGMLIAAASLRAADDAARELRASRCSARCCCINGIGIGHVRRAEHDRHHEQRAARAARRRVGHARHVPEHRHGAVDRRVLLADDRRPVGVAARTDVDRSSRPTACPRRRPSSIATCPPVGSLVRRVPRLQPDGEAPRRARRRRRPERRCHSSRRRRPRRSPARRSSRT